MSFNFMAAVTICSNFGAHPVVLPGSPLRLGTRRERDRGGANPGGAGRGRLTGGMADAGKDLKANGEEVGRG